MNLLAGHRGTTVGWRSLHCAHVHVGRRRARPSLPATIVHVSSSPRLPPEIELQLANWALGWLLPEDVPGVAVALLVAGFDSPELVRVAGDVAPDPREVRDRFERALDETGLRVERTTARIVLTRHVCNEIVAGRLDPYDGAQVVWREVTLECPRHDANASLYDKFGGIDDSEYETDLAQSLAVGFLELFPPD